MKRILSILIFYIALGAVQGFGAAETYELDWSYGAPSVPPVRLDPESRMLFTGLSAASMIVDASTTPPNPFPEITNALWVIHADPKNSWFRQHIRFLEAVSSERGTFQIEFRLVKGDVRFQVGGNNLLWDPAVSDSHRITNSPYLNVTFSPDSNVVIDGVKLRTASVDYLEKDKNYTFSLKWDMAICTFFLNDEPLLGLASDSPHSLRIKQDDETQGINTVRISLGSGDQTEGEFFLGKISASSE